ncbi:DUF1656 domain-containing protein [Sphingomonas jeddahensis]|uniref:DUF1656 domain-containing protein n=1 Tax=Sphingomonas jeddahensis TaxID=1915074 RepID=A0A1V2EY47_9SPHN|nr:DUF1656 domain-containing protein [Sphingomonas jeddahensis]ONF97084.1 hypothetical protein SPHI_05200 [Sphingomonas jeddahensis]
MKGEIAIGGVFVPTLLLLGIAALVLTFAIVRVMNAFGLHRIFAYRAAVDLAIFVLVIGGLAVLLQTFGIPL